MKRGFEGLNGSNPAAQLTWLVLRVVGELSPCSKASLVDRIAGGQPSDAAIGGIVSSVLTKLQEFGFLTVDGDQITITEDGRNFLEQSPYEESDVESDSYPAGGFARLKAVGQSGFAALRGFADTIRKRGDVSESASAGSARDWVGSLDGAGRGRLVKIGGAAAMVAAFIAGGVMFLERTDAETTDEMLLVGAEPSAPGPSAAAPADVSLPMDATAAGAPEEATAQTGPTGPGPQESENFAALPDPAPPPTADPVPASVQQDAGPAGEVPDPESASESTPTEFASAEPEAEPTGDMGAQPSEMDASAPMTSEIAADGVEPDATVFEQAPADPVIAAIRAKLADPGFGKKTAAEELAALESFYAERDTPVWVSDDGFTEEAQAALKEIADADSWGLSADTFRLPSAADRPPGAEAQADQELDLALAVLKYARFAGGGRLLPTRVSPLFDQKPQLREPKTVLTEISSSDAPDSYLRSLHPKQEQFHRLRQALLKARAGKKRNATPDVQRLLINMERWRWMPGDLGALYVWSNVPEFNVRVIKAGKTAYLERAIVGQRKYATPLFSASMRSVVFHPDWVVPETIVREDLKPSLQQGGFFGGPSTGILRRHNLQVSFKGRPVEAETVDWGAAKFHQYTFTQPAGPDNVLGELKFNFPNRHAVYMHDTPQRNLFDQTVRTFSHGCIRVREPNRLAALLLAEDKGWSATRIKAMLEAGRSTAVSFARPVPVHLTYFTAVADDKGNVESFPDVYGIDTRMSALLFAKPAKFDVPVVEAKAEWRPRGGPGSRSTTVIGGIASEISGLFSN